MVKNFQKLTYVVDTNLADTFTWLSLHQDCFDRFIYDSISQQLRVEHANGVDVIREGDYLNASYGILITAHNFVSAK